MTQRPAHDQEAGDFMCQRQGSTHQLTCKRNRVDGSWSHQASLAVRHLRDRAPWNERVHHAASKGAKAAEGRLVDGMEAHACTMVKQLAPGSSRHPPSSVQNCSSRSKSPEQWASRRRRADRGCCLGRPNACQALTGAYLDVIVPHHHNSVLRGGRVGFRSDIPAHMRLVD